MAEWVQENRRAVVMLAVAMSIALLAGLYLVLSGGEQPGGASTGDPGAPAETAVTEDTAAEEAVVEVEPAVRVYSGRGTSANPFAPVEGERKGTGSDTASEPTAKPTSKPLRAA